MRDLETTYSIPPDKLEQVIHEQFRAHRATLRHDRRHVLERFEIVDMARKVVGVGSVGTRAFVVLLQGRDQTDPLFLQVKEATASVLEDHLSASRYKQHGERVVYGQRMLQAASDILLGVLRVLCRPERAGLPGVRGRDPFRPAASPRRHVRAQTGGASRASHRWEETGSSASRISVLAAGRSASARSTRMSSIRA
jgi:hypothetical protein